MMNEFYQDLMFPLVYKWMSQYTWIHQCDDKHILCLENEERTGTIHFYQDNLVECSIMENQENIFYLHFQMHDFHSTLEQLNTFFDYMVNGTNEKRSHYDKIKVRNILLSCSSGLTTSYYAYMMNEFLKNADIDIHVEAISYTEIEKVADDYDVILLAPQIKYLLPELKQQYGHKVFAMNTQDFATNNYMHVLEYLSTEKV